MNKKNIDFFTYIKNKKNAMLVIILLIVGLFLLMMPTVNKNTKSLYSNEERLTIYIDEL